MIRSIISNFLEVDMTANEMIRYVFRKEILCSNPYCGYFVPYHMDTPTNKQCSDGMYTSVIECMFSIKERIDFNHAYVVHLCANNHPICLKCYMKLNSTRKSRQKPDGEKFCILCREEKYQCVYVSNVYKYYLRSNEFAFYQHGSYRYIML